MALMAHSVVGTRFYSFLPRQSPGSIPGEPRNPKRGTIQTIEEYKAYTKQLEVDVGKWHHAYDALIVERDALVRKLLDYEPSVKINDFAGGYECVAILRDSYEAFVSELEELRKHELAWDLDKARIKELESEINQLKTR